MMERKKRQGEDAEVWGDYMKLKKQKLESQFTEQAPASSKSNLFSGISIFVNGYTEPSASELKHLMMIHGGTYCHYYKKNKYCYIIASNLAQSKINALRDERVVSPKWIVDCIEAEHILPIDSYLIYNKQPNVLKFTKEPMNSAYSKHVSNRAIAQHSTSHQRPMEKNQNQVHSLVSEPKKGPAATASDENFLSEFYSHSRLHHISNSGAEFKQYVALLQNNGTNHFPNVEKLKVLSMDGRNKFILEKEKHVFMHLDMDCFFVSVGLRSRPNLRGKPVAVSHSSGQAPKRRQGMDLEFEQRHFSKSMAMNNDEINGNSQEYPSFAEIASCNYEARSFGLKNGMFLGQALKLCPNLQLIPYDFDSYKTVSFNLYDHVASYTHDIEAVSCDEMFVDCTKILHETGLSPVQFADHIRKEVRDITGCESSAGLGQNLLLARLATRKAKPNGSYYVKPCDQGKFMADMNVRDLPGVGRNLESRLKDLGVRTCEDLQSIPLNSLRGDFGQKTGDNLFKYSRGICNRRLQSNQERKSVSAEVNYGIRFQNEEEAFKFLRELSAEVAKRLKKIDAKGKAISLKLKVRQADAPEESVKFLGHGICDNVTRSVALKEFTDSSELIYKHCSVLLRSIKAHHLDLRGVGIQVNKLNITQNEIRPPNKNGNILSNMFKRMSDQKCKKTHSTDDGPGSSHRNQSSTHPASSTATSYVGSNDGRDPTYHSHSGVLNDFYPSQLCQVDESVLQQLPEEIHQQVIEFYSRNSARTKFETITDIENSSASDPSSLPDIKNIDQSVFSVLPPEIQQELRAAYKQQVRKTLQPCVSLSPAKSKRSRDNRSPAKPRVKSKGSSPFKYDDGVRKITNHLIPVEVSPKKQSSIHAEILGDCKTDDVKSLPRLKTVEFCGSSNLDDIKNLIKEWIYRTKDPAEEDLKMLTNYLVDVVKNKDLERVDLLVKHLHRQFAKKDPSWHRAFIQIVDAVQLAVIKCHGSGLRINTSFEGSNLPNYHGPIDSYAQNVDWSLKLIGAIGFTRVAHRIMKFFIALLKVSHLGSPQSPKI